MIFGSLLGYKFFSNNSLDIIYIWTLPSGFGLHSTKRKNRYYLLNFFMQNNNKLIKESHVKVNIKIEFNSIIYYSL